MEEAETFEAHRRLASMIVLALLASVLIYFLVAYMLSQAMSTTLFAEWRYGQLRQILYGIALVLSIGIIVWRRSWLSGSRLSRVAEVRGSSGLVAHLKMTAIVFAALGEAVALLGLVLSLMTHAFEDMVRLGGIGVVLILYNYPRRSAWLRVRERFSHMT